VPENAEDSLLGDLDCRGIPISIANTIYRYKVEQTRCEKNNHENGFAVITSSFSEDLPPGLPKNEK
jgi:hypothetical protein